MKRLFDQKRSCTRVVSGPTTDASDRTNAAVGTTNTNGTLGYRNKLLRKSIRRVYRPLVANRRGSDRRARDERLRFRLLRIGVCGRVRERTTETTGLHVHPTTQSTASSLRRRVADRKRSKPSSSTTATITTTTIAAAVAAANTRGRTHGTAQRQPVE